MNPPKTEAQLAALPPYQGPEGLRLRFLGTGTSAGVPLLGCQCSVCRSSDPRDRRLRTAALLETRHARILLDAGPDIRQQLMPLPFYPLDGVLLTHEHYDHVGGLDDLRGFCLYGDLHLYADRRTTTSLRQTMPYCFAERLYPGVPLLEQHVVEAGKPFYIKDVEILPFNVLHGRVPILGYRVGDLVYITDMKSIPEETLPLLQGVDTLVVNALRWAKPHHSHMLVDEALDFIRRVKPRVTYLVHLNHQIGHHDEANARLPEGVQLAYDGQELTI